MASPFATNYHPGFFCYELQFHCQGFVHWLVNSQKNKIGYYTYTGSFICDVLINFCAHFSLYLSIHPLILFSFNCIIKRSIFLNILENLCQHSPESFITFPGIFSNIRWNLFEHSPESLRTFPKISSNIPRNLLQHSPESSERFLGTLVNISRVPHIPRILFPVHVFLVL